MSVEEKIAMTVGLLAESDDMRSSGDGIPGCARLDIPLTECSRPPDINWSAATLLMELPGSPC